MQLDAFSSLGFYLLAPQRQYDAGVFGDLLDKARILDRVTHRVAAYAGRSDAAVKQRWLKEWFEPGLARLTVAFLSWERLIEDVSRADADYGAQLQAFYDECLRFNAPRNAAPALR